MCAVLLKCARACLFLEESQQPTYPQVRHMRKCTQRSPVFAQSSQEVLSDETTRISDSCVQLLICFSSLKPTGFAQTVGIALLEYRRRAQVR